MKEQQKLSNSTRSTTRSNSPQMKLIGVWVPDEVAKELAKAAKARDLTKSQIIRKAIKNEIKQPA
jgi:metal-responsive CopG/Arc/MetJ family transcriptional regulator